MPDLNSLFSTFNNNITLTSSKKEKIKTGRNALRKKIRDDFKDKNRKTPTFCGQGSYMMKTTINPLAGKEYDIDDGIYIKGYNDKPMEDWPTTQTVHNWIKNAVDGHTSTPPVDKNTCVRVIYVGDYHIDLPSYIIKDEVAYLSHLNKGWIESDPKAFTDWFIGKVNNKGEQLRSIVKYLKAWRDYKEVELKGIEITILVGENFYSYANRDDKSLLGTVTNIIDTLEDDFKCKKPVTPKEDLFDGFSDTKQQKILNSLKSLKKSIDNAINAKDDEEASGYLIKQFGDRFPKGDKKSTNESSKSDFITTKSPGILKNDGRSA